jgi:hypothetical protein
MTSNSYVDKGKFYNVLIPTGMVYTMMNRLNLHRLGPDRITRITNPISLSRDSLRFVFKLYVVVVVMENSDLCHATIVARLSRLCNLSPDLINIVILLLDLHASHVRI